MIFDTIANAPQYFALHPHFEPAFEWLAQNPDAEVGKYEIIGDDLFVMIQMPEGQGKSTPLLEAHNQYLDIQIVLEGEDEIGWKDRATCSVIKQEYSEENDAALWTEEPDFYVKLAPGSFTILYPNDAHAPVSGIGPVRKAVFKVRASQEVEVAENP